MKNFIRASALAGLLLLASPLRAEAPPAPPAGKVADLQALLTETARKYMAIQADSGEMRPLFEKVQYTPQEVRDVVAAAGKPIAPDVAPLVLNGLIAPLWRLSGDDLAKVLAEINPAVSRSLRFRDLQRFSPAALRQFALPDLNRLADPLQAIQLIEAAQKRRAEKFTRDEQVIRYNCGVLELARTWTRLKARSSDKRAVAEILALVTDWESKRNRGFVDILWAAADTVRDLPKGQVDAAYWAKTLELMGQKVRLERRDYVIPVEMNLGEDASAEFARKDVAVGKELLRAADVIADKHGLKRPSVPNDQELKAYEERMKKGR